MSPVPLMLLCIGVCLLIFGIQTTDKEPTKAESFKRVNEIVAEAKASPNGKPLLDYIISLQEDGLTKSEAKEIAVKYEDWKLFYSLKDAEAKQAVELESGKRN